MASSKTPKRRKNSRSKENKISFDLKPESRLQITIETGKLKAGKIPVTVHVDQADGMAPETSASAPSALDALASRFQRYPLANWLFLLALGMYLITRLIGLTHFPIYFFTDEAIQTQSIADLISNGYRDGNGFFLPSYFRNGNYANLSFSVYLQWIPLLIFGKSALVTRVTSVMVTLIAAVSVGLILRNVFKRKYWWAGTLLLSITPAWFFHSRTAFETAEFTALFAGTLCAYLFYRHISPRYIHLFFLLAALAFYTYSPGQLIIPVLAMALLISDWRYHWENRKSTWMGLILLVILIIPYVRYRMEYPDAAFSHLYTLGSYLVEKIPWTEKIRRYVSEYGTGLSAWYWYIPNNRDLARHLMKDYGHLMIITLPFAILGLAQVLTHVRESANRTVLISLLVSPLSAALVQTGITRALIFVVPAALLTSLGLELVLSWVEAPARNLAELRNKPNPTRQQGIAALLIFVGGILAAVFIKEPIDRFAFASLAALVAIHVSHVPSRLAKWNQLQPTIRKWKTWVVPQTIVALIVFTALSFMNVSMLNDALKNGPLWFRDYGMGGMQYGGFQIFEIVKQYKQEHPETRIIFSPNWANGTNVVARFFLGDPMPFEIASVEGHITQKLFLDANTLFVMTPDEYKLANASAKFTDIHVEKIVPYPDGTPGFYFVRLRYVDHVDEIFAAEKALRDVLREAVVFIDGQQVKVRHTYLDAGTEEDAQQEAIRKVFDNDPLSLAKTFEANPFVIEMTFPTTRIIEGFSIVIGSARAHITLKCYPTVDAQPLIYTFDGQGSIDHPELSFDLPKPAKVQVLQVEMLDPLSTPPTKVHIWELKLR
jgi:4-amino-4-deoxy-L-arabinose transferase-like glycosyltransferase